MVAQVEVQLATDDEDLPGPQHIIGWANMALAAVQRLAGELTVRVVGEKEMAELNHHYRGHDGATNVLSFLFEPPPETELPILGDVVVCAPVVRREAQAQGKSTQAHFAHMVAHGVLHLCGHSHQHDSEAQVMEALEARILTSQGFADPYQISKL
ncbi:MAG: rRNA maturation RNase YbeY [Arenicellales bacterium]|nr:rRNA maturation RNase YbeY [Arenicellales bacterium]